MVVIARVGDREAAQEPKRRAAARVARVDPDERDLAPDNANNTLIYQWNTGAANVGSLTETWFTPVVPLLVVEADPPRRFSFRWAYDEAEPATPANSLLVTFDLVPSGGGTWVRFRETGFREQGWEAAVLEEQYRDHVRGWDYFLPRLVSLVARLVSAP